MLHLKGRRKTAIGKNPITAPLVRASSVQAFIKRVKLTYVSFGFIGFFAIIFLIYQPLRNELELSLIDNFIQLAYSDYASIQSAVQRQMEGARGLTSRVMIKEAIIQYNQNEITFDELKEYTTEKYEEGAIVIANLDIADRYVNDMLVTRYTAPASLYYEEQLMPETHVQRVIKSRFETCNGNVFSVIVSPVIFEGELIGYDRLIFNMSSQARKLQSIVMTAALIHEDEFRAIQQGAEQVLRRGVMQVFHNDHVYYIATYLQDGIYLLSSQSESRLFSSVSKLSAKILFAAASIIIVFISLIYIYLIRFAKRELGELEVNQSTLEKLTCEINIDALTGAGSRSFGMKELARAFDGYLLDGANPAVIMIDLDEFKRINDRYGHDVGDRVMQGVVNAIFEVIRSSDPFFRWGGDEFVGIFRGVKEESAIDFSEKILTSVSSLKIPAHIGRHHDFISPTVSIGISYFHTEDKECTDVLKRADRAMYHSKENGRNRAAMELYNKA